MIVEMKSKGQSKEEITTSLTASSKAKRHIRTYQSSPTSPRPALARWNRKAPASAAAEPIVHILMQL